jgi:hypothetical protein
MRRSRFLRPVTETAMAYGLFGWIYVAAYAATRPQDLSQAISVVLPLRRDTFGCLCFAVSAIAAVGLQIGTGRLLTPRPRGTSAIDAVLRTVTGYALLVWIYLCVNSLTHPDTIGIRLTHFAAEPTEGETAVACYAASAVAFTALRLRAAGLAAGRLGPGTDANG